MGTGSFPGIRSGRGADLSAPSAVVLKKQSYTCITPMGRTACTEPQCLYKGALYLLLARVRKLVFRFNQRTKAEGVQE